MRGKFLFLGWMAISFFSGCAKSNDITLTLGAYTAPREAYAAIIPLFQEYWFKKTGQTVKVKQSYLGSGAQARAIVGGFEADIAALSMESDIELIVKAGLIHSDWKDPPYRGMVTTSVVALAVRQNNPKGITDWADMIKPDLQILTPDPKSSGGAMWNILAAYGAAKRGHVNGYEASENGARKFLADVFRNVTVFDKGARESIINFERGIGDVVITYESEVLVGKRGGQIYELVLPTSTILVENPVAVVDHYAEKHGVKKVAEAFRDFLWTEPAQAVFAEFGLRPVEEKAKREHASKFSPVQDLWTVDYLGSWNRLIPQFFGPRGIFTVVMEEIRERK